MVFNNKEVVKLNEFFQWHQKYFFSQQHQEINIFNPVLTTNVTNKELWTRIRETVIL